MQMKYSTTMESVTVCCPMLMGVDDDKLSLLALLYATAAKTRARASRGCLTQDQAAELSKEMSPLAASSRQAWSEMADYSDVQVSVAHGRHTLVCRRRGLEDQLILASHCFKRLLCSQGEDTCSDVHFSVANGRDAYVCAGCCRCCCSVVPCWLSWTPPS